jgi:hypothetical protein
VADGVERRRIAEVPLADHAGAVALLLQQLRQQHFVGTDAKRRTRPKNATGRNGAIGARSDDVAHADAHRIASGHERRPRRGARRGRHVEVREPQPLARHPIEMRRVHVDGAKAGEIGVAQVIGQDDDEVGSLGRWQRRG